MKKPALGGFVYELTAAKLCSLRATLASHRYLSIFFVHCGNGFGLNQPDVVKQPVVFLIG